MSCQQSNFLAWRKYLVLSRDAGLLKKAVLIIERVMQYAEEYEAVGLDDLIFAEDDPRVVDHIEQPSAKVCADILPRSRESVFFEWNFAVTSKCFLLEITLNPDGKPPLRPLACDSHMEAPGAFFLAQCPGEILSSVRSAVKQGAGQTQTSSLCRASSPPTKRQQSKSLLANAVFQRLADAIGLQDKQGLELWPSEVLARRFGGAKQWLHVPLLLIDHELVALQALRPRIAHQLAQIPVQVARDLSLKPSLGKLKNSQSP